MTEDMIECKLEGMTEGTTGSLTEETPLLHKKKPRWTRKDVIFLLCNCFIRLGNTGAIHLPGVIVQEACCRLGVDETSERILGVIFYVGLAIGHLTTGYFANRVGRRPMILLSLYLSVGAGIVCSIFPSYYSLLVTFSLTGVAVGLSNAIIFVDFAEHVSSHHVYVLGNTIANFSGAFSSAWVPLYGYLVLDTLGWRGFMATAVLPFFCVAIVMQHTFIAHYTQKKAGSSKGGQERHPEIEITDYRTRVVKLSMFLLLTMLQGFGSILLLPALLRYNNEEKEDTAPERVTQYCTTVVHGIQFLYIFLGGAANVVASVIGYFLITNVPFRLLQGVLATVIAACFAAELINHSIVVIVSAMTLVKLMSAIGALDGEVLGCDPHFMGSKTVAWASGVLLAMDGIGGLVGNIFAEFLEPMTAVMINLILSVIKLGTVFSLKEVVRF